LSNVLFEILVTSDWTNISAIIYQQIDLFYKWNQG